jgi:hypothetical protein
MRGVVRFGLVGFALCSALASVGCAAGDEDALDAPPPTITASTPRKVFRGSPADIPVFDATGDRTTLNGAREAPPAPLVQPPQWGPAAD